MYRDMYVYNIYIYIYIHTYKSHAVLDVVALGRLLEEGGRVLVVGLLCFMFNNYIHICVHIHMCIYIYIYIYTQTYIHVCMCIYIYI